MTVVLTRAHDHFGSCGKPCMHCGLSIFPPFFEWHGNTTILMCRECVVGSGVGIQADMIQLRALGELHRLGPGYHNTTLERSITAQVEKKYRNIEIEGRAIIREMEAKSKS